MRLFALSSILVLVHGVCAESGALYPPGLLPLINRANALLSTGQFNEAAKVYTEAIEQSPADYLLYYKRATAYFSLSRHLVALDDFEKVLLLTSNTFDNALLMKAKILSKDGRWVKAREALNAYFAKIKDDQSASELLQSVTEGEAASTKATRARKAQLWTACTEAASQALKVASHSIEVRQLRGECALASGDIEGAVGDLTRLTHLSPPSTVSLMRVFRLSYFFLPASASTGQSAALATLKQCLHFDPDSKHCLPAHRLVKSFDKSFAELESLLSAEDWRGVIKLLIGTGKDKDNAFARKFDDAMDSNTSREQLLGTTSARLPLPLPAKVSPRRQDIVRAICRAYVNLSDARHAERWCDTLLGMEGAEDDQDGLVGKAEALLLKEDWEEAVRLLDKAFLASGRSNRDIHARLQRAQKLLKASKQKDYYKVLDVPRDADARTIKKAYKKAALTFHPDKGGSEAKMAVVNEAYGVLSDPGLRQRFDNGDDPNDPMTQQGGHPFTGGFGGEHPFAQFFQQGGPGGGGFQFHFSHGGRGQ